MTNVDHKEELKRELEGLSLEALSTEKIRNRDSIAGCLGKLKAARQRRYWISHYIKQREKEAGNPL